MIRRLITAAALGLAGPAAAQTMDGMDHGSMHHPAPAAEPDHAAMDHGAHAQEPHHVMTGALGAYPMSREASGTAWQPDVSQHGGLHVTRGDWMLMGHAVLNGVYSKQNGPRGDDMTFASGMVMGMARRPVGHAGTLQLRAMLSPDPLMGKRGYPQLLSAGETADGVNTLVDRQHPHDLFMELSASYSRKLGDNDSVFLYAGLPGEPAFGPPAFMHRLSIMDSPEAPITHHWLDSTHITFGVLTAGYVRGDWKVEASRFKGREPDQHRYNIESPKLSSTALRLSWNPTANWSLQVSWADVKSPEQLEPDEDQRRWSASAIYTAPFGHEGWWSTTAAWGRRTTDHRDLDALVLESALKPNAAWTVFSRAEHIETDELTSVGGHHGPVFKVAKVSLGAIHDWTLAPRVKLGLGALHAWNFTPSGLSPAYDGDPRGAMAFVRLKIG